MDKKNSGLRMLRTLLALALSVALLPSPAAAWGNNGHV